MVNITYGVLVAPDGLANNSRLLTEQGTDLVVTYDGGKVASYGVGDLAWVMSCTTLVWLMIPGLGYLYSGLARRKNALHLILLILVSLSIVSLQWFLGGYSLVFAEHSSNFWGNLRQFGFMHVLEHPSSAANNRLPHIVFASFELMFACLAVAIALGAACDRSRLWPMFIFIFFWTTLVYDPIAMWIWNPNGWAYNWGVLDYAGGGVVEITSGMTGLVMSIYLGRRYGYGTEKLLVGPHNVSHVVLGTVLLWVGWLGFNGGAAFAANLQAAMAISATNLAASAGGVIWMVLDYRLERKWSVVGFCTGAISGLVAITPAAGFVGMPAALLIGVVSAFVCNMSTGLKNLVRVDDAMDVFALHALGGILGLIMTGIFAQKSVAANDGYTRERGGWLSGHFVQLPLQLAWCAVTACWTIAMTFLLMFVIDHIPYVGPFRPSELGELVGMDVDQCGEAAYDFEADEDHYAEDDTMSHRHLGRFDSLSLPPGSDAPHDTGMREKQTASPTHPALYHTPAPESMPTHSDTTPGSSSAVQPEGTSPREEA